VVVGEALLVCRCCRIPNPKQHARRLRLKFCAREHNETFKQVIRLLRTRCVDVAGATNHSQTLATENVNAGYEYGFPCVVRTRSGRSSMPSDCHTCCMCTAQTFNCQARTLALCTTIRPDLFAQILCTRVQTTDRTTRIFLHDIHA
jgi:hypothetical protein